MSMAPAYQIRQEILRHLHGAVGSFSLPIPIEQIRGILDASGTPKETFGILVSVTDLGDHAGCTGRILVDVQPQILVYTHINDDPDGSLADSLATDVLNIMPSIQYGLDGWLVSYNGNWTATDAVMMDNFRQITLSAQIPLQRVLN